MMLERIKRNKLVSGLIAASAAFILGGFAWAMASFDAAKGPFILHFNDLAGITSAGGTAIVVFAGIFGIAVVLVNGCLAFEFAERNAFFGKLTAILTLVFAILLFIAFAAILSVN
jgi:hypothetical protein